VKRDVLFALTPCLLSRVAGEGKPAAPRTRSTPLSHAVGEGLGVRAKNSGRATHAGFVLLEIPTGMTRIRRR